MVSVSGGAFMAALLIKGKARRRAPETRKRASTTRKERRILLAMVAEVMSTARECLGMLVENGFRVSGCS
jgi:hypothetical protein